MRKSYYDYIWGNVICDDESDSQENLSEFKKQILNLIDAAFAENKENYVEESEKIKLLDSLVNKN